MRPVPEELVVKVRRGAEAFAALGYEATRVEDLTKATGIPSSTMYYYFAGKQELLAFLVRDYLDVLAVEVSQSIERRRTPATRLEALVRAHLRVMAANPLTCQVLLRELGHLGRLPEIAEAVQSAVHRPLQKILADGVAAGDFALHDTESTTSMIYGAVTMGALHHLVAGDDFDPDHLAGEVLGMVTRGITR